MLPLANGLVALTAVLVGPHTAPERLVIRRDHSDLAASRHNLVLTETPSTDTTDAAPFTARLVRLRAVLSKLTARSLRRASGAASRGP